MTYIEKYVTMPDDTRLYYRLYNPLSKKDPIICLPGLAQNSLHFHGFAQRRMTEFDDKLITIDMCGRGRSDYCDDSLRYDLLREVGDIIHIIIMSENIDKASFVGTSRGGMQAMIIAGMRPDIVTKIVLNDIGIHIPIEAVTKIEKIFHKDMTSFDCYEDALKAYYVYQEGNIRNLTPTQEAEIIYSRYYMQDNKFYCRYDAAGMGRAFENNMKALEVLNSDYIDLSSMIENIRKIPTLLLRGELSLLVTEEIAQKTLEILEDGTLATIKDRGHAPTLNESDAIKAVDDFL